MQDLHHLGTNHDCFGVFKMRLDVVGLRLHTSVWIALMQRGEAGMQPYAQIIAMPGVSLCLDTDMKVVCIASVEKDDMKVVNSDVGRVVSMRKACQLREGLTNPTALLGIIMRFHVRLTHLCLLLG